MTDAKVLIIEPSNAAAQALDALLQFLDIEPIHVRTVDEIAALPRNKTDWLAVLVSQTTLDYCGAALIAYMRAQSHALPLVYVGAQGLPKCAETSGDLPWLHLDVPVKHRRLSAVLAQAERLRCGRPAQPGNYRFRPSGESPPMRAIHRLIEQVAPADSNVLILGESGTGKEMVARHIHELSRRSSHPFVPVNCGAIPTDLLESELFGHEKGAFTGALTMRMGRFEFAEGGTLFLDEIGDMSLQMQVKLLRVLQERSFERVGSNRTIRCDVRIIAATHRDLESAILAGQFREDLYYRLNVFPVQIPPLRDRLQDLPLLIEHLLERQRLGGGRALRLSKEAMNCLMGGRWPGNVRELANLLERLAILHPDQIIQAHELPERYRVDDLRYPARERAEFTTLSAMGEPIVIPRMTSELPAAPVAPASTDESGGLLPRGGLDLKDHLSAIELVLIRKALEEADGTVAEAARLLRMRRTTLVEKLRKYRLHA